MKLKYSLKEIKNISFSLKKWDIIFFYGDLGAWKTTMIKYILNNILSVKGVVSSPTYTYYNKYFWILDLEKIDIFHFDLYKLSNYGEFFSIWAEDILDNNNWIILIEWPELIKDHYTPDLSVSLFRTNILEQREIEIRRFS